MIVGFLANQLDRRGTGNALFDYAHYNKKLLKNESKIYTFAGAEHNPLAVKRFEEEFQGINYIRSGRDVPHIDVLYHIKYGTDDGFRVAPNIRYAAHAVFEVEPHGDRYAAVSHWLANRGVKVPFVPHMVETVWSRDNLRESLGIPEDAFVVGRHGGFDTFDIPFVWEAIVDALILFPDIHFVLMNTKPHATNPRVHYVNEGGPLEVRKFLNTCDAMLHARERGETFGIAVGEFAVLGKPVITYEDSGERAHIEELGDRGLYYRKAEDIVRHIAGLRSGDLERLRFGYMHYSYSAVMKKFKEVFLDE